MSHESSPTPAADDAERPTTPSGLFIAASGPADHPAGHPSVVLVHGALDRSAGLLKLSRRLDSTYRVVRYDRRGYGRSREVPPPFTMAQHVKDLGEVIATSNDGPQRRVLFGHSYGGNVALAFAQEHPDSVAAVVVYEPPLSWLNWWPGTTAGAAVEQPEANPEAAAEAFMRRLIGDAVWDRLPAHTREARRSEGVTMVDELRDLRLNPPWNPRRVEVPVLALSGENGKPHHQRGMRELATMLPNATSRPIHEAAHFGPNTHPGAVSDAISEFIGGL